MSKRKSKPKTLGYYKRQLWPLVSRYVRLRDCLLTTGTKVEGLCVSCGVLKRYEDADAGHFVSVASSEFLHYDERNIHLQCKRCNGYLEGNFAGYYNGLKSRFGDGFANLLLDMHQKNPVKQWKVFEIQELIEHYSGQLKKLGESVNHPQGG